MKETYLGAIILALMVMMATVVMPAVAQSPNSLTLDKAFYKTGDTVAVTVQSDSLNVNPVLYDTATIHVSSTTDTVGHDWTLHETGVNTGEFTGTFVLTGEAPPGAGELVVKDGDTITVTCGSLSDTATVDDTPPAISDLTPADGAIVYDSTPTISAVLSDPQSPQTTSGSGIDSSSIVMTVNGSAVTPQTASENLVSYVPSTALAPGTVVNVTVDVSDKVGNPAETAAWSFTVADRFNVSLNQTEIAAATGTDVTATFKDVNGHGITAGTTDPNQLKSVKITLKGPGVDLSYETTNTTGDQNGTYEFGGVTPEQAGELTATFVGTFGDDTQVTKTVTIPVTGFKVPEMPLADVQLNTTHDIAMTVTTAAGGPVNTGIVTITAPAAAGFQKDVDGDGELESFNTIVINGSTGKITYKNNTGTQVGDQESITISGGHYVVTGIKFAAVGDVEVAVTDAGSNPKAKFTKAFSVLGNPVYSLSFDPAMLTAGVDGTGLVITITETDGGAAVTDVTSLTFDGVSKSFTKVNNVYTVTDPLLYNDAKTLSVIAKNGDQTKYGTASLGVGLPSVAYTTTGLLDGDGAMFSGAGYNYTVHVTVTDALGNPLANGKVWLGTYNADTGTFTPLAGVTTLPLNLDANGEGDITITQNTDHQLSLGNLVWKVGSGTDPNNAALLLTPVVHVVKPNTAERAFNAGWNLVSVPLDPSDPHPAAVFGDDVDPLYMYEYTAAGYVSPATIDPGHGYWIYLIGDTTLDVEGSTITTDYSVNLADAGWHIISTPTVPVSVKGEHGLMFTHDGTKVTFTEAVAADWIYPACFGYGPSGYVDVQNSAMDPWLGYWIKTLVPDVTVTMPVAYSLTHPPVVPEMSTMSVVPQGGVTPPAPPMMPKNLAAAMDASGLIVYNEPNPVRDVHTTTFKVKGAVPIEAIRVEIFDQAGQLVFSDEQPGDELAWHTENNYGENLANGVYLYRVSAKVNGKWVVTQIRKLAIVR